MRKKTPSHIEEELLVLSARRCCLCFGINNDYNVKPGQIAHLDRNPTNSDIENLAWLCLEHHDRYDSRTSQSKGYTTGEVKHYRETLYAAVEELRKSAFTDHQQQITKSKNFQPTQTDIREQIRQLLNDINPEVVRQVDRGERAISVMISLPKLNMLQELTTDPYFADYLAVRSTGSVSIGSGNRIGNAINDVSEGFLQGLNLYPTPRLRN